MILSPEAAQALAQSVTQAHLPGNELTDRERDVLRCMVDGLNNKEIAEKLIVSLGTVKFHISNIFQKLQVNDRTEAAVLAVKRGLI
jgi:NarL family two-component system response regulator LiaR